MEADLPAALPLAGLFCWRPRAGLSAGAGDVVWGFVAGVCLDLSATACAGAGCGDFCWGFALGAERGGRAVACVC